MNLLRSRRLRTILNACLFILVGSGWGTLSASFQPDLGAMQQKLRLEMVATQIEARGVKDKAVLAALRKVPRHRFVPAIWQGRAYADEPLPIGDGQTISQPYIVGWMTELIEPTKKMRVLEIGTGSGYQAAVLAECVARSTRSKWSRPWARRPRTCSASWAIGTSGCGLVTATRDGPSARLTTRSS